MNEEKIALVTGAGKGIGLEVCRELAERGFRVFLSARNKKAGQEAVGALKKPGAKVDFLEMDVADPESVKRGAANLSASADHLDVLVNNAGILQDGSGTVLETDPALVLKTVDNNAVGPLRVTQAMAPLLGKSRSGRVINVSSGVGALNGMENYAPAYSISKTALNAVTRQLASALKPKGIAVNSVTPGHVRTDMGGQNAPRSVKQGADSIVWLATEAPQKLTGEFIQDRRTIPW